jgi:hypothetical protein
LPHPFPQFIVSEIGLDAVRLSLRMFCSQADFWHVHWDFPQLIKWSFERYGISFQINRTEVEFTGGGPKFSAFADAQQPADRTEPPPDDGDSDGDSDVEGHYSLATMTLEEKWKRHAAMPHRRKLSSAIAAKEAEALAPNDDEDETDNIGDLEHYAPKVRSFDYRVARPSERDRKRLHALTARWHELVSDIDEAERHKLASDNVVRAAKSRWRRLRRKLLKRTGSTTSSADESKRLERLKSNTKQTLVGLGQLQSAQHDRELVQRVSSQKSPRKSKGEADADDADDDDADDVDADNGATAAPSDGKRKSRVRRRTARRVRSSSLPSVEDEPTGVGPIDLSRFASAAPGSAVLETASFETTRPDTARPASARPPSARLPSAAPTQEPSRRRHRGESAPIASRRLRRTFSENTLHVRHFQAQSLAPSDEESTEVPSVHVVQVDEEALATLDASGDWWEQGGFGGS